ncbi:hypothetical protein L1049_000908 [Liquidambar formosana]|uniref:Uncharacterized protein n=1 Tax=Liquidambar formosana TaxID=63359 RepID=A0AAP0ND84_LIQFO
MDLESECSALESVGDNDVSPEMLAHVDGTKIKNNGSFANKADNLSSGGHTDSKTLASDMKGDNTIEFGQPVNSPPVMPESPGVSGGSPPSATKGYGLKKWRRIRRDFIKDASPSVDSSKVLKRGLATSVNPTKPLHPSVDTKQKSEGSVGSTNLLVKGVADYSPIHGSSSDSRLAVGSALAAGTDSENNEDQSSKSSTAASAPKVRYDMPAVLAYARDKNRMKSLSGKSGSNSVQRVQQGKGRVENTKKPRGERVKIEKENSHSSMESDSRSSNFVFMQGAFSTISNGKQSGKSRNYYGENSDEAQASEQQFSEELRTGYSKENVGEVEDSQDDLAADLSWEAKGEKSENHQSSMNQDPLVESLLTLQSVQEALEKEVQKLVEVGKEFSFTSTDPEIYPSSFDQFGAEDFRQSASCSLETQVISLTQNLNSLESKLEEARAMLEAKETRIVELEATLSSGKSPKDGSGSTMELQEEKIREMETEVEGLFKQKIEAEIEYLATVRTIQNMRVAAADKMTLFEEQKTLAGEQSQMLNKLEGAESKAEMLKKQAEEFETCCEDILGTGEVLDMQKRVCKVTWCFLLQLILLVIVVGLFVLELSPHSVVVVPT